MMLRIGHCIDDLSRAGAQTVVKLIVQYADPQRFRHHVYAFRPGPLAIDVERAGGIVALVRKPQAGLDLGLVRRLAERFRSDGIDLVHTHLLSSRVHGAIAARLAKCRPCVTTLHEMLSGVPPPKRFIEKAALAASRAIVAVCDEVAASIGRQSPSCRRRTRVILNGIDGERVRRAPCRTAARQALGLELGTSLIVNVARLDPKKGHKFLLAALPAVLQEKRDTKLIIVGDGRLRDELDAGCRRLGIRRSVVFMGEVDDVRLALASADVFALSSLFEGLPMTLLEAMAAGLPCVASAVGGVRQVLVHGEDGLLVPAADADALADALLRILRDARLAGRLGGQARAKADGRFHARRMVEAYQDVYEGLCAVGGSPKRRWMASGEPCHAERP